MIWDFLAGLMDVKVPGDLRRSLLLRGAIRGFSEIQDRLVFEIR
jgi:hypothetical protein